MVDYPESDEFVLATVKKLMPYGAFCMLDEYAGMDSFLHVSQVSSGWVRNIREHLREGQKIVAKVTNVDREKGQIDLSLKQVTEADRKRKLASFQAEKKARKLIDVAAAKLKQPPSSAWKEVGEPLVKQFGSVAAGLEALREGQVKTGIGQQWIDALKDIVAREMKAKTVTVRKALTITCPTGDGIHTLKHALESVEKLSDEKTKIHVHYLAAPNYFVDVTASDYKTAEKTSERILKALAAACENTCEFDLAATQ